MGCGAVGSLFAANLSLLDDVEVWAFDLNELHMAAVNRDGLRLGQGAFELWPQLKLEHDAAHAFYMGVELAHAEIAWKLGKRYVQDQPLDWGVAVETRAQDLNSWCAPGTTMTTGQARNTKE